MKLIYNDCYGGISSYAESHRKDADLIRAVENHEYQNGDFECLAVANLPDNITDYYIDEYDGNETVIYVVDGKIHFYSE